jgi:hypothetical protein
MLTFMFACVCRNPEASGLERIRGEVDSATRAGTQGLGKRKEEDRANI